MTKGNDRRRFPDRSDQVSERPCRIHSQGGDHLVEMVRCLRVARATAVKAHTQAANALRALLVTAPAELREQLRDLPIGRLACTAARLPQGQS